MVIEASVYLVTLLLLLTFIKLSSKNSRTVILKYLAILTALSVAHLYSFSFLGSVDLLLCLGFLIIEFILPRERYGVEEHNQNIINVCYLLTKNIVVLFLTPLILLTFQPASWGMESSGWPIWLQGITALLLIDFKQYWVHRGQHWSNTWWKFHQIHHSTPKLNILAADRTQLLEWFFLQTATTQAMLILMGVSVEAYIFYYLPGLLFSRYVAHLNVYMPWKKVPWWAYFIASPNVHAYHHTKLDKPCNFGEVFIFWDVLFRTFRSPVGQWRDFGVSEPVPKNNIIKQQLYPFTGR